MALQFCWQPVHAMFAVVLSAAGFFLVLEFFLDSISAAVFLTRIHRQQDHGSKHQHRYLQVIAYLTSLWFIAMVVVFLIYAPQAMGRGVDVVIAMMVVAGLGFVGWGLKNPRRRYHIFDPELRTVTENADDR
jgi:L-asparagine transporter-like permease